MVSMHVLVDGSSLWRQRLQHIDITLLSYNAVRHHGTRLPRYKEGRLYNAHTEPIFNRIHLLKVADILKIQELKF